MALNLSRNTKVFVSSVNGVHTTAGGILTAYVSTPGTAYAVGDIVELGNTSGSGAGAKCIVLSITGGGGTGPVATVAIPNNFRGRSFGLNETALATAVETFLGGSSSGSGLVITVLTKTDAATTAEGSRAASGLFKGNETDCNTFRIGVLDGYSFSQGSESTDVTINEAGAEPNRGSKRFNDALPPAEWSFGTYVRPFVHGAASFRASGTYDMVENIMWAALAGAGITGGSNNAIAPSTAAITGCAIDFDESNVHELLKLNIYFALENTTYRLNDAQVNQAEIDFSIDGIAQITWSGNATTIDQVSTAIEDPSKYGIADTTANGSEWTNGKVDTYAEGYNFADTVGPSDADYLRNKLSSLYLDSNEQGGGTASGGLPNTTYDINITGGSITIANNVTYITPETIGIVDKPIGSFTGARTITGSLTMYLDNKDNGSNQLLTDLAAATDLVTNEFDLRLFMGVADANGDRAGGAARAADDFTAPGVDFWLKRAHLQVPTIETGDLISTTVEFAAHGESLLHKDELTVKYLGSTTHTQTGYHASSSRAV